VNGGSTASWARRLWLAERFAWTAGILCLTFYAVMRLAGAAGTRRELSRFENLRAARWARFERSAPDQSLWSPERVHAWRESLRQEPAAPLGVLRIPKIRLEVPVLEGTDEWTLNRGVGHIPGTSPADGPGNLGIAGHRDGFFRRLKDVVLGDTLEIETFGGRETYVVERVWIVGPEEVSVLDSTAVPSVTLVTCYPFYYVGSAPQRYIVRAVRAGRGGTSGS
jgi:sortase A